MYIFNSPIRGWRYKAKRKGEKGTSTCIHGKELRYCFRGEAAEDSSHARYQSNYTQCVCAVAGGPSSGFQKSQALPFLSLGPSI